MTYQAAGADFDNDGDLDLLTGRRLFRNGQSGGHWLKVRLIGDGRRVNRDAVGAQVRIRLGDRTLTRHVETATGECNQNDLTLHFGLGDHGEAVVVEVRWPGGRTQRVTTNVDQQIVIERMTSDPVKR